MTIKQLRDKYPYIVKYDQIMGSFSYWTNMQLRLAEELNAPEDTCQIDASDNSITRIEDIKNESFRKLMGL